MADETPAPLSDAEIAGIAERARVAGADVWEIADEDHEINGYIGYIGPLCGYDGDALGLRALYNMPLAEFVSHAPQDIHRLLATLAAYREIVAAVAGGRRYVVATARTPSGMTIGSSSLVCVDDETVAQARALLATSTPPATAQEGE